MFKVYQHRRKDTNEIFYVGHGGRSRPWQFTRGRSQGWQSVYNQFGCVVETLAKFDNKQDAADFEIKMIAQYRKQGIPLVNKKDGGFDRNQGLPLSKETRQKISAARLKTNHQRKAIKTPLGIFVSKVEASKAHGVHWDTIGYRIKHWDDYKLVQP